MPLCDVWELDHWQFVPARNISSGGSYGTLCCLHVRARQQFGRNQAPDQDELLFMVLLRLHRPSQLLKYTHSSAAFRV